MHLGLVMECDHREGRTQDEAFDEAFATAEMAEALGFDGVWLAERHFAAPRNPLDPQGAGIPSVVSSPLIFATAIASRTSRLRVGTAVLVLPLGHPVRMAEEVATLDNISRGRLDLGIGRSGFPRAYQGYNIPYGESRERFREYLEVMRRAWTQERFSYEGKYYTFQDVCLIPKPYQKPHPPLRYAATTKETFPLMGDMGLPIFVGLRGMTVSELVRSIQEYRDTWREAGHPGEGDVALRVPIYVAETEEKALSEPEDSALQAYGRLRQSFIRSTGESGTTVSEERAERAERLANTTYQDLLRERLAYGTPQAVIKRLEQWRDELGLTGIIIEANVGGRIPQERVSNSIRLFAQEVAPALR
jgi:alkanesulfonate monooxygenase SsuD/methylene tetrahydromethanopterin reductase-like flavin-dependent oxidoreductase (luciferase family)